MLSVVLLQLRMQHIPCAFGYRAYLSVWLEVGAFCMEHLAGFFPSLSTLFFPLSSGGQAGPWLGFHVLQAIRAVSILELATNSGSSRMFQAPDLHLATQLLKVVNLLTCKYLGGPRGIFPWEGH